MEDNLAVILCHQIIHHDGWLRKKWVIQNQKRVLLKSGSGESQQEPLNEVLANMICDRLDIKNYVKYQCGYQEDHAFSACDNFITPDTELITANMFMKIKKRRSIIIHTINIIRNAVRRWELI